MRVRDRRRRFLAAQCVTAAPFWAGTGVWGSDDASAVAKSGPLGDAAARVPLARRTLSTTSGVVAPCEGRGPGGPEINQLSENRRVRTVNVAKRLAFLVTALVVVPLALTAGGVAKGR
jgi:hypothetical protein